VISDAVKLKICVGDTCDFKVVKDAAIIQGEQIKARSSPHDNLRPIEPERQEFDVSEKKGFG
jgi:hypothetical protein